jgi:hypothetical protein
MPTSAATVASVTCQEVLNVLMTGDMVAVWALFALKR